MKAFVVYMMGGIGSRFNADKPKQFVNVKGKPVFLRFLETIQGFEYVDGIIVVCQKDWIDFVKQIIEKEKLLKVISVVPGGSTRSQSVKNGLFYLRKIANDNDVVLIHDATHPFIDKIKTIELIEKIKEYGAGSLANYVFDTAYIKDSEGRLLSNIDRKTLAIGASPEGFRFGLIYNIFSSSTDKYLDSMTSTGALMADNNIQMVFVETKFPALKITYPDDLKTYEYLIDLLNGE